MYKPFTVSSLIGGSIVCGYPLYHHSCQDGILVYLLATASRALSAGSIVAIPSMDICASIPYSAVHICARTTESA